MRGGSIDWERADMTQRGKSVGDALTGSGAVSTLHPSNAAAIAHNEGTKEAGMARKLSRSLVLVLVLALAAASLALPAPAAAVDAPKWVAALFVEAQRSVGLRWMPVPGATAYKVLRSEKAGADYKEIAAPAQPQHFDTAVEPGSTYYYVLQAVAGAEVSANSAEKSVTIPGQKKQVMAAPEWPKDPTVQESTEFGKTSYRVGLVWSKVPDAIAYNVYKSAVAGKDYQLLSSVAETQVIDSAVEVGKSYYYVVSALDPSFQETPMSAEKKVDIVAAKKEKKKAVRLVVAPRATKKLWQKERGDENGKFDLFEPFDIVVDEGNDVVYATSNSSQAVYSVNASTGEMIKMIGGKGTDPGLFLYPLGLAVDGDGILYVVDRQKKSIQTYRNGTFAKEFPLVVPPGMIETIKGDPMPMDVAVDWKTGDMYVADRGINRIWVLDDAGKVQRFVGEPGTEVGKIMVPEYLQFDPTGKQLVVINANQTRVSFYDKETGAHVRSFGEARPGVGTFIAIGGHAFDKEGNVIVVDKSSAVAQGFLPDGRYLFHLGNEKGDGGVPIFSPKTLAIDSKNRVFFAEGLVNRIQAFQITGAVPAPQQEAE